MDFFEASILASELLRLFEALVVGLSTPPNEVFDHFEDKSSIDEDPDSEEILRGESSGLVVAGRAEIQTLFVPLPYP